MVKKYRLPPATAAVWIVVAGEVLALVFPIQAIGAVLGGVVALLIAFVAYPWQKELDRKLKIREEQRVVLRDALNDLNIFFHDVMINDKDASKRSKYKTLMHLSLLKLYFRQSKLVGEYEKCRDNIREYYKMRFPAKDKKKAPANERRVLRTTIRQSREAVVDEMQIALFGEAQKRRSEKMSELEDDDFEVGDELNQQA